MSLRDKESVRAEPQRLGYGALTDVGNDKGFSRGGHQSSVSSLARRRTGRPPGLQHDQSGETENQEQDRDENEILSFEQGVVRSESPRSQRCQTEHDQDAADDVENA
jgi:hypothetical protein